MVAAAIGVYQAGVRPHVGRTVRWWREQRDISSRLLGESLVATGGIVLQPYGLTAVAGLQVVGAIRAGQLIVGPFNVVFQGTTLVAIPEGARTLRISVDRLRRACLAVSLSLAGAALAFSILLLIIPEQVGLALLRTNWAPARSVLPALCVALVGVGATSGAVIGMRVLAAVHRSFPTRVLITVTSLAAIVVGGAAAGASGAAVAMAITSFFAALVWWRQFLAALKEYAAPDEQEGKADPTEPVAPDSEGLARSFVPPGDI